jgi:hypothetical protein
MKKIIQAIRISLVGFGMALALNGAAVSVHAQTPVGGFASIDSSKQEVCQGAGIGKACNGASGLNGVVNSILNLLSVIVGVAAVIMIIISGFRYITSGGDASKVGGAKSALIYAIVGLVIVALAQVIVHFVLAKAT